jgi:hypothetical protein
MDATHDTPPVHQLPADVEAKLSSFRPTTLERARFASARTRLLELARATAPETPLKAGTLLSSACRFLADVAPTCSCDVDDLLTEANVARWSHRARRDGMDDGTLANHLGRLNRLLRAKSGHGPVEPKRASRRDRRPPYRPSELVALAEALAVTDPAAASAVTAGAGAGVVVPNLAGATINADPSDVVVITAGGERKLLTPRWHQLAARLDGTTMDRAAWVRARTTVDGEPLNSRRIHLTWVVDALDASRPLRNVLDETGLRYTTVDDALRHLPQADAATAGRLLRG